jgi:hypothetical protein
VWFDAPVLPAPLQNESDPAETETASDQNTALQIPTRPIMQVQSSIQNKHALVLLDSVATEHNYISADFCNKHGLKLQNLPQPFTAAGVQGSGQITQYCKVFVRMATYTGWLQFSHVPSTEAGFTAILGDKWLHDNRAILNYAHRRCVVSTLSRMLPLTASQLLLKLQPVFAGSTQQK